MIKNVLVSCILFSSVLLSSGCQTAKGVTTGLATTTEGVVQDTTNTAGFLAGTDAWVKKNLW